MPWIRTAGSTNSPLLKRTPPLEHLVRVHPVRSRHLRHARARLQRQLYNPPLLCNRPKSAYATSRSRFLCMIHDAIVGLTPEAMPEGKAGRLLLIQDVNVMGKPVEQLDTIARAALGVPLSQVKLPYPLLSEPIR